MRVVVTGATGNVGTSVLDALVADPESTRSSASPGARRRPAPPRKNGGDPRLNGSQADVVTSDLGGPFAGADAVVHLAWLIQPSHRPGRAAGHQRRRQRQGVQGRGRRRCPHAGLRLLGGRVLPRALPRPVDERWPTAGVDSSVYARHKSEVERLLDRFEADHRDLRVVRLRPGLIFKREAASSIRRLVVGRLLPPPLLRPKRVPLVPRNAGLVFQAVHATDVADAYRLALLSHVRGAFNIAADPVLDSWRLAQILHARTVRVPTAALRLGAEVSWRLRLQPTPAGWVDLAMAAPVLDTRRARRELGWQPTVTAGDALVELLEGLADRAEGPTPALSRRPNSRRTQEEGEVGRPSPKAARSRVWKPSGRPSRARS